MGAEEMSAVENPGTEPTAIEWRDLSLLDAVRGRPRMWRDVDGWGA
jgi:hypothetical protein